MHIRYCIYIWGLFAVPGNLAEDIDFQAAARSISAALADPSFAPYTKSTRKIREFIAVGDSYTAGTGCNGNGERMSEDALRGKRSYPMQMSQDGKNCAFINDDDTLGRFSFHAYTGNKSEQLITEQLEQGDYKDGDFVPRNQPFGKAQVAVATNGSNDAMLSCRITCQTTLDKLQLELDSGSFQDKVNYALYQVAPAGRQAGGADPCEAFCDARGPECNDYTWALWPSSWSEQLNDKVRQVNAAIKAAAEDLKKMGVIVWFWTDACQWITASEGPGDPSNAALTDSVDLAQVLLEFDFSDEKKVVPAENSADNTPPWEWNGAEKYPDLQSLLDGIRAAAGDDADTHGLIPIQLLCSFHPNGTAYATHATALFAPVTDDRAAFATGNGGQQIAIASYINPLGDSASWERLLLYDTQKFSLVVATVLNGLEYVVDKYWKSMIDQAASQGKKILGNARTISQTRHRKLNRISTSSTIYTASVSVVYFFDKEWLEYSPNSIYVDINVYISDYTKRKHSGI
ncbi:hypothetical protein F1880_004322 [Penicillium rolfsii]|nr:hypothetical protein F1880_004322 [Penicillium rolfsii]